MHGASQNAAIDAVLSDPELGWAGVLLFNERTGRLVDGHARKQRWQQLRPGEPAPVLIGSWSEAAERKLLATIDPLGDLATIDADAFKALSGDVDWAGMGADLEAVFAAMGPPPPAPEPPPPDEPARESDPGKAKSVKRYIQLTEEQAEGVEEVFARFRELHEESGKLKLLPGQICTLIFADWRSRN